MCIAVWHVSVCIVCISACICIYWFTCTSFAEKLMGVSKSWSVSAPLSRPFSTTVPERAGFGGPAPHKLGPSSCTCPLRNRLCISSRSPTSSAVCPCSLRGNTARFPEACPVARMPAFPEAGATRRGSRGRAARCTTSTRGPWYGRPTTRRRRVEALKKLVANLFQSLECIRHGVPVSIPNTLLDSK